jgi:fumarate hydratase class II
MSKQTLRGSKSKDPLTRIEHDSFGEVAVPRDAYWGAQTQRSIENFPIGCERMPIELIRALIFIKKACALANCQLHILAPSKCTVICAACDEMLAGNFLDQFPLSLWQTGSGTQTNMNVNEVIANRANELSGSKKGAKTPVHPNDDVNQSQSTNDVFPTAIHIAATFEITSRLLPSLKELHETLKMKAQSFRNIIKVGRTHLMDAAPLTLGQEFSGYAAQVAFGITSLKHSLTWLQELAIGATAVGTGINAPRQFAQVVIPIINALTNFSFISAKNKFAALAAHDALVSTSGMLKQIASSLFKIANDIRWMASGPRAGLGELALPENEPGSSIMPGKVNPTQAEALTMVAIQVMGNDTAIGFAGSLGNFELNVFKPLMAYNLLQSIRLLADAIDSFNLRCAAGISANKKRIQALLEHSLMQGTALNPYLGYDKATKVVQKAHLEEKSLKQAAIELGFLTTQEAENLLNPNKMIHPIINPN